MIYRTESEVDSRVPITAPDDDAWKIIYSLSLPAMAAGSDILVTSDFEVKNDTAMNVEIATKIILTEGAGASRSEHVSSPNGSNLDRKMHYIARSRSSLYTTQGAYDYPYLLLMVRAKSTDVLQPIEVKTANWLYRVIAMIIGKVYRLPDPQEIEIMQGYGHLACTILDKR
jgi:hypothetical protein